MSSNAKKARERAEQQAMEAEKQAAEKKQAEKAAKKAKVKKKKPLIITAAALITAAAVLVTGYFGWYKPRQEKPDFTDGSSKLLPVKENTYTYEKGTYNGYTVPAECVKVLEQGDEDCRKAALKYGVAMKVGETQISVPEFGMLYYDTFSGFLNGYKTDANGGKLQATSLPSAQSYLKTEYTWQDKIVVTTRSDIQELLVKYRAALEAGVMPADSALDDWKLQKSSLESMSKNQNTTVDALVQKTYCEGVTLNMYLKYLFIRICADAYTEQLTKQYEKDLTPAKTAALFKEDPMACLYADVHIFTASPSAEINPADLKAIHDEDSFLEYAGSFYKEQNIGYNKEAASYETRWQRVTRSVLAMKLGGDVVDWVFNADRKSGDVGITTSNQYLCVVYLDRAPYDSHSMDVQQLTLYYNSETQTDNPTEEEMKLYKADYANLKEQWASSDKSADAFSVIVNEFSGDAFAASGGYIEAIRRNEVDRHAVAWLFDEERKPGDYEIFDTGTGSVMYYVNKSNPEDKDSDNFVKQAYLESKLAADLENMRNGEAAYLDINEARMKKAVAYGEASAERRLTDLGTLETE